MYHAFDVWNLSNHLGRCSFPPWKQHFWRFPASLRLIKLDFTSRKTWKVMCEVLKINTARGVDFLQFDRLVRVAQGWTNGCQRHGPRLMLGNQSPSMLWNLNTWRKEALCTNHARLIQINFVWHLLKNSIFMLPNWYKYIQAVFLVSNVSALGSQIDKVTDEKSHAYCSDEDTDGFPQASREHYWPWVFPNYYERNCSIIYIQQSLEHACWICACGHTCDVHKEYHIHADIVIGGGIIQPAEQRHLPYRILKMHAVCMHTGVHKYMILCDGIAACISSSYQHPVFGRDFHYPSWGFPRRSGRWYSI